MPPSSDIVPALGVRTNPAVSISVTVTVTSSSLRNTLPFVFFPYPVVSTVVPNSLTLMYFVTSPTV